MAEVLQQATDVLNRAFSHGSLVRRTTAAVPRSGEVAWATDSFFGPEVFDPDTLRHHKGKDVYDKMLRDPQVKAAYRFAVNAIISRPWSFDTDGSDRHKRAVEFFEHGFDNVLVGSFRGGLRNIATAMKYGFSLTEKIYAPAKWQGKQYWFLQALKMRPPHTFTFETDRHGNVTRLKQMQDAGEISLDYRRFIHHVVGADLHPIYGESELRAAYQPYWEKMILLRLENIYLERMASGFVHGKLTRQLTAGEMADLKAVMRNLSASTSVITPDGVDLEMITAPNTDAYKAAIEARNREIGKSLMLPTLLGLSDQGKVGSMAQANVQMKAFFIAMILHVEDLAEAIQEHVIAEMYRWNFGADDPPRFHFDPLSGEEKSEMVKHWLEALGAGAVANTPEDEKRTRMLLGYPQKGLPEDEAPTPAGGPEPEPESGDPEPDPDDRQQKEYREAAWRARVEFAEIERGFDDVEAETVETVSRGLDDLWGLAIDAVAEAVSEGKDALEGLPDRIAGALRGDPRRVIWDGLIAGLRRTYDDGRARAISEVDGSTESMNRDLRNRIRMAARCSSKRAAKGGVNIRHFAQGVDLQVLEQYLRASVAKMVADMTDKMAAVVTDVLTRALTAGWELSAIIAELVPILQPLIGERDAAGRRVNVGATVERMVRTAMTDAFNQARLAVFMDPDLGDFVEAFEYSAVIDSRTTEFCRATDGKVYPKDDPVWDAITPPNHFNCRSLLIAVTIMDQWAPSAPLPASVQPKEGFGTHE